MKRKSFLLSIILSMFFFISVNSQSSDDYFLGKWTVKIVGTPLGDFTRYYLFEKKDGKIIGVVQDTTGNELSKMTRVEVKNKTITGAYTHEGFDVTLSLSEVDPDHVKGNILGSYDATGVRMKKNE